MTNSALKLPFGCQPEMTGSTTFLAGNAFFDPHVPVTFFAGGFIRKLLNEIQRIHVFFHANLIPEYAKSCRGV